MDICLPKFLFMNKMQYIALLLLNKNRINNKSHFYIINNSLKYQKYFINMLFLGKYKIYKNVFLRSLYQSIRNGGERRLVDICDEHCQGTKYLKDTQNTSKECYSLLMLSSISKDLQSYSLYTVHYVDGITSY